MIGQIPVMSVPYGIAITNAVEGPDAFIKPFGRADCMRMVLRRASELSPVRATPWMFARYHKRN